MALTTTVASISSSFQRFKSHILILGSSHSVTVATRHNDNNQLTEPRLPDDIILEIARFVTSSRDLLNLSLVSRGAKYAVFPILYESVCLRSNDQCITTLRILSRTPKLAARIRSLTVRPNGELWLFGSMVDIQTESAVGGYVQGLAENGCLGALQAFGWEGLDVPFDGMWLALRTSCPNLRNVSCNTRSGGTLAEPESNLFAFSGLESFSFTYSEYSGRFSEHPPSLWEMLFNRCPDLHTLALSTHHNSQHATITQGRWPKLHTLKLSEFGVVPDFIRFLRAHHSLTSLEVTKGLLLHPLYDQLTELLPTLERLTLGCWAHSYNTCFIPSFPTLTHLDLGLDAFVFNLAHLGVACNALRTLKQLTSLCVRTTFEIDNHTTFYEVLKASPGLLHFELRGAVPFSMETLSNALKNTPNMRSVTLTKFWNHSLEEHLTPRSPRVLLREHRNLQTVILRHGLVPDAFLSAPLILEEVVYEVCGRALPGTFGRHRIWLDVFEMNSRWGARVLKHSKRSLWV